MKSLTIAIQPNAFENVSYKMMAICSEQKCYKYSLSMCGIKMEDIATFIFGWMAPVYKGVSFFNPWTTMEIQRGTGQHGYDLNNLNNMWGMIMDY